MEHNQIFEKLSPTRLFFRCALPSMVSMAVTSLYIVADGIFVGRFIGADALAAVNLVMPFIMISFALADMIAVGSSVQISIKLGEKNHAEAGRIFSFCSTLIVLMSVVVGIIAFFTADGLVMLMGADQTVTRLAASYMRVYAVFSPLVMIFFALDNYLRICAKNKYSMVVNISTALANIVLDWLFIVEFGLDIESAALASCISLAAGTFLCLIPLASGKLILRFTKGRLPLSMIRNIVTNGSSEFFANISGSTFMVIINIVLLKLSGPLAVAAFSIVMYADSIVKSLIFGMADSLQPALSYNHGAGRQKRVYALERRIMLAGMIISNVVLILMQWQGDTIIAFFVEKGNTELLEMSIHAMRIFSLSYLVCWFGTIAGSFFTALNKPFLSFAVAFSQTLFFPLACIAILPPFLGLEGVWLTSLVASAASAILAGIFMIKAVRMQKKEVV